MLGPFQWIGTSADQAMLELSERICSDLDIGYVEDTVSDDDELPPLIPHLS
jgi:hypothetical protein